MSSLRFLIDEDVPEALIEALVQQEPTIDILAVGDPGAPPKGTKDPDLLLEAEAMGRLFISRDKKTMPGHLADHFTAGHHTAGVVLLRPSGSLAAIVQDVLLIWHLTEPDEWIDRTVYLPY